jgi:H+/gluconate symporter-like permease
MAMLIHFIGPFVTNIISAFGIIIMTAKRHSNLQKKLSFNTRIRHKFHEHKHLIISGLGLILLALPRIILAFRLECMQSARNPVALFLLGYFISYLPPLFLFIVFVVPSSAYKKTFKKTKITRWKIIRRWICCK